MFMCLIRYFIGCAALVAGVLFCEGQKASASVSLSRLKQAKYNFEIGKVDETYSDLRPILVDINQKNLPLSPRQIAEAFRLFASSSLILGYQPKVASLAFQKSMYWDRFSALSPMEKENPQIDEVYNEARRTFTKRERTKMRTRKIILHLQDPAGNRVFQAKVEVENQYSPFEWSGQTIEVIPEKVVLRIESSGYEPLRVTPDLKHSKLAELNLRMQPLKIPKF